MKTTGGIALAIAAASLFGCASSNMEAGKTTSAVASEQTHCYGVNKCKGFNDCKTANNACKGQAGCKGLGFVNMSKHACEEIGGKSG